MSLVVGHKNIERKKIEEMVDKVAERSRFNIGALASMALFCAGVWLVPSGMALHFAAHDGVTKWSHLFMSIHNTPSFLFVIAAVVHVIMNWKVLTHYLNTKVGEYLRFKRELLITVLDVSAFLMLVAFHALAVPLVDFVRERMYGIPNQPLQPIAARWAAPAEHFVRLTWTGMVRKKEK